MLMWVGSPVVCSSVLRVCGGDAVGAGGDAAHAVGAVADDRRGGRPVRVGVERIAAEQLKPTHGLALYEVDGEVATRSLLVFVQHVAPGGAHRGDGLVERDEVTAVAAQGHAGRVDRRDGGDRV